MIKFGSVCSGIEAASAAWHPIGWEASWLAEIEPFPSAVLNHHYPNTPNYGDMTKLPEMVLRGEVEAPDVLVGGTPCQSFSVAGMRQGLSDDRGQLTIKFVELADAIDTIRQRDGKDGSIIVWENVPGVLSSKDNAFGCFLGALAGEDCELKPSGKRWSNAGFVLGPKRAIAWRILDAQYFGLAQRRKRIFLIASARKGPDPAKILFEFEGMRRDSAPSRSQRDRVTAVVESGACLASGGDVTGVLMANAGTKLWLGNQEAFSGNYHVVHGTQTPIISKNLAHVFGRNNGQENVVFALAGNTIGRKPLNGGNGAGYDESGTCYTLTAADRRGVAYDKLVRRLTPIECERLQGFPDNYTQIPWRGKPAEDCPDSHRYKALGNSMAVPVMRWIGERIKMEVIK